jgi:ADP-heptose:LPS heptosyltransferase
LSDKITNYASLASAVDSMDLIITIDTGLAHLAGAMGKTTWTLIGTETDWRWMDNLDTTPWYQSMRLFRYKTNWDDLIKEVVKAIP